MSPCGRPVKPASGSDGWYVLQSKQYTHTVCDIETVTKTQSLSSSSVDQPLPEWEYNGNPDSVGYRVQYSRTGAQSKALLHVIADRLEREFTIEDLEEWTEYEVRVQAINGIGAGPWSQPVRGRTRESGKDKQIYFFIIIY